ncbi:MAG: PIN domain-containing protein [Bryobacteraceae bacterium]
MSAPDFLDTNVLVCAYDRVDRSKQRAAQKLVAAALNGAASISVQVLAELSVTLLHKASPPLRPEQVAVILDAIASIPLVTPDREMVRRAVEAREKFGIHFYDGMIVAAAERAGCARIWSEDLNPGQVYFGIPVTNPFV